MKTTQQTSRDGIQRETQPVSASAHSANSPAKRSKTPSLKSVNLCSNIKPSGESVEYKNKRRTFLSVWVRCKLSTDVKVYKSVAFVSCGQVHWQQVLIGPLSSPRTSLVLPQNSRDSVCVGGGGVFSHSASVKKDGKCWRGGRGLTVTSSPKFHRAVRFLTASRQNWLISAVTPRS